MSARRDEKWTVSYRVGILNGGWFIIETVVTLSY
jgi:hypothetical protein